MRRSRTAIRRALRYATVLAVVLFVAESAFGFYFAGWPGDGRPRRRNLVSPDASILENPPSARQDIVTYDENPRWERSHDDDVPNDGPSSTRPSDTPEPGTLATALVGVTILGLAARWRRQVGASETHVAQQSV